MISIHSNESINHKETYSKKYEILSEHQASVSTRKIDHLCTPFPNSGIGSYTSQPCGTHRPTLIVLMEIMIQPKIHIKKTSMANTHARQYDD